MEECIQNKQKKPWKEWRLADSLLLLLYEVNNCIPKRNKLLDGTIGDLHHQSLDSDHNPWVWDPETEKGIVTALDITHDPDAGCDCQLLSDFFFNFKDKRIKYIIWNKMIVSAYDQPGAPAWTWQPYNGSNPHTQHLHISVKCKIDFYDLKKFWGISLIFKH